MCGPHTIASSIWYHINVYYIVNVEPCSIVGAVYVRVRQTMPRSLRYAATICVYDWWRLAQTTTMHTRSAPRRRGGGGRGRIRNVPKQITFPAKYDGVAHTNSL
jgi:hypothetical protein